MLLRIIFISALFCIQFTSIACAKESKNDFFLDLIQTTGVEIEGASRYVRIEVAKGLKKRILSLKSYIPTLSPAETQWLENELVNSSSLEVEASTNKLIRIMQSEEWHLAKIHIILDQHLTILDQILGHKESPEKEVILWVALSYSLLDELMSILLEGLSELNTLDLSSPRMVIDFGLAFDKQDYWFHYETIGRNILLAIVLPMLSETVMKDTTRKSY